MSGLFTSNGSAEEGFYYALTKTGAVVLVLLALALVGAIYFLRRKRTEESEPSKKRYSAKQLVYAGMCIAVAFALSYVRVIRMPWGGAVTLCSMLFITLIGYWYGPAIGLTGALSYSVLQFVQDGGAYILSPLQAGMDYFFAFTALGVSGFFSRKKDGLRKGYLCAVLLRGIFHTIGGYLYWMDYMPDNFPKSLAVIYPFAYNYSFLLAEAVITLILISLPPVANALRQITKQATS